MYKSSTTVRIRYADTDQMGYCYYGNYATFFEVGRVEALRNLGISYRELESVGILMPVITLNTKFLKPARYDDVITIETTIPFMPGIKIRFDYECLSENGEKLVVGSTDLVFLRMNDHKPVRPPESVLTALKPFFG
jgi:acyl-CoA thioester hydrolase